MRTNRPTWDDTWFGLMKLIAKRSPDIDTQVGCVIVDRDQRVLAVGYNGLPAGVKHTETRVTRPEKYKWMVHADLNAILSAGRNGVSLIGATMYLPGWPCNECAKAIIQSGITKVCILDGDVPVRWMPSVIVSAQMFREAKVTAIEFGNEGTWK